MGYDGRRKLGSYDPGKKQVTVMNLRVSFITCRNISFSRTVLLHEFISMKTDS
jgi:hypothetical protein